MTSAHKYPKDLSGLQFERLLVVREEDRPKDYKQRHSFWLCQCQCGESIIISRNRLVSGHTKSCGCLKADKAKILGESNVTHGLKNHRIYQAWRNMISRCYNPNNKMYKYYGEKGVSVVGEWLGDDGLLNFYNWSCKSGYQENLTIDRIDVDGNYEPNNCRWTTIEVQSKNKSNNIITVIDGIRFDSLKDVANHYHISYSTVYTRYRKGLRNKDLIK